jgi:hypothetical protein
MASPICFARAVFGAAQRGNRPLLLFLLVGLAACAGATLTLGDDDVPPFQTVAAPDGAGDRYALPITDPLDQGDTGLCWVFATLSMLETNYMSRHPGAHVEFSRGAVQRDAISDRFRRLIRGEAGAVSDGGLAVEALELIRQNGLFDRRDFHDVADTGPIEDALKETVAGDAPPGQKAKALDEELTASLGPKPETTHLEGRRARPAELARAALGVERWTEYDLSRDGTDGWGPSRDPDARPETRVDYVARETLVDLIHNSLAHGEAVVIGTVDHAVLVYGADYDEHGKPLSYLVKDSMAPYLYRAEAESLHSKLNDVTVSVDAVEPESKKALGLIEPGGGGRLQALSTSAP